MSETAFARRLCADAAVFDSTVMAPILTWIPSPLTPARLIAPCADHGVTHTSFATGVDHLASVELNHPRVLGEVGR